MKRRREDEGEAVDRAGRHAGLTSRQGAEAMFSMGIGGGSAGQGGGEAMAVDAQSGPGPSTSTQYNVLRGSTNSVSRHGAISCQTEYRIIKYT